MTEKCKSKISNALVKYVISIQQNKCSEIKMVCSYNNFSQRPTNEEVKHNKCNPYNIIKLLA